MAQDFPEWLDSLAEDRSDPGGLAVGALEFLREVFDERGPVSADELLEIRRTHEFMLARDAVELFAADVRATTQIDPRVIDVRRDDPFLIVSFKGNYQAPAMFALRAPESICEVAENLRDHVVEEVWTVWPACPEHDRGLTARPVDCVASWVCPVGDHAVAAIGSLGDACLRKRHS